MTLFQHVKAQFVSDLKAGQSVDSLFRVVNLERRAKKDGTPFLTLTIMDRTGRMEAKVWDDAAAVAAAVTPGAIHGVSGTVKEFRGRLEIHVQRIQPLPAGTATDEGDFVEAAAFNVDEVFRSLIDFIRERLEGDALQGLLEEFVAVHGPEFSRHYGAQRIHHARVGGLLQHTASMVRLAALVADHYELNRDILLMGALLHDLGKLREYVSEPSVHATTEGGLLGHIVIGLEMFDDLCRRRPGIPTDTRLHLRHLIISHHGEKEFGSPEVPKTQEAMALHAIDLLDSKLAIFRDAAEQAADDAEFSEYIPVIGRRVLVQKPRRDKTDE